MSFKTWYHNDYLRESDLDNSPLDAEAPIPQQEMPAIKVPAPTAPAAGANFQRYFTDGNLKASLSSLGKELGDALVNFALKEYVTDDMFDGVDNKLKYETEVRNKIAEDYNLKLIEVLRNAGIFLATAKDKYTK
jgi:hypothetical protein